ARYLTNVFGRTEAIWAFRAGASDATRIYVHLVTANYFTALGVQALYGRVLLPEDEKLSSEAIPAVLSYPFWQRYFHGDPKVIGQTASVKGVPIVIVGVLPRGFNGILIETSPEVRVPAAAIRQLVQGPYAAEEFLVYEIAGRLAPGATIAQAKSEVTAAYRRGTEAGRRRRAPGLSNDQIADWANSPVELEPLEHGASRLRSQFAGAAVFLAVITGLLLVLVCASAGGLLMARLAAREHELAVRLALGATRGRLIRQTLTETLLLASAGGLAALSVAFGLTPSLGRVLPPYHDLWGNAVP